MKNTIKSFRVFNFTYYFYLAVFVGFTMPYLKHLGFSATKVGLYMSIIYLFGMFGQFFMGYICDLKSIIKAIYIICIIALTFFVYVLFHVHSQILIGLTLAFIGFFQSPSFALLDCWVLETSPYTREHFGSVRAFGSIGWGLCTLIVGKIIDITSYDIIPYLFVSTSIFVLIIAILSEDAEKTSKTASINIHDIKELLKDKVYLHLVIIFLLCYISFQSIVMVTIMMLTEFSGKAWDIGLFTFIASWSEIPILLGATKLREKIDIKKLLVVSTIFFTIRATLTYFATSAVYIIILSSTQMFSFGIFIFISKYLVDEISPDHLKTSSQTIMIASSSGLSGLISSNTTGILIDTIGISNTIVVSVLISMTALILSIWYYNLHKHRGLSIE